MMSENETTMLAPGAVIGILGGGQLGRMLAIAAAELGFICHIYAPAGDNPAFDVAARHTEAAYEDKTALAAFAQDVDVVTYEFENIPDACLEYLVEHVPVPLPVRPGVNVLAITQDRIKEKTLAMDSGIDVPDFVAVDNVADIENAIERIGRPCVLKTRRFGYDGKGQTIIREGDDLAKCFTDIGEKSAILESFVPFDLEVSIVAARDVAGKIVAYDIPENRHENHILATSHVPANISKETAEKAMKIAKKLANALEYVGVFAVELFVSNAKEGNETQVLLNEIAPRVHNSGHWTQDACHVSQFEQHIRAVAGLPLADPFRHSDAVMYNLLGQEGAEWGELAMKENMCIHLYGKAQARDGRKMGHATQLSKRKD